MERVAEHMGVDRKTVHRHLGEEGTRFSAIVDAVRTELVNRYIDESRAALVGGVPRCSDSRDSSAFSRWFKQRFGRSVSAWRADNQTNG